MHQLENGNEILGSIFAGLDPHAEEKDDKPLRVQLGERLDRAIAQLEGESVGEPVVTARLQVNLGKSLLGLGYPEKAVPLLTRARQTLTDRLGIDHPDNLICASNLANGYHDLGWHELALELRKETLAFQENTLGQDHPDTL